MLTKATFIDQKYNKNSNIIHFQKQKNKLLEFYPLQADEPIADYAAMDDVYQGQLKF